MPLWTKHSVLAALQKEPGSAPCDDLVGAVATPQDHVTAPVMSWIVSVRLSCFRAEF